MKYVIIVMLPRLFILLHVPVSEPWSSDIGKVLTLLFTRKIEYLHVFDAWTRISIQHQYPSSSNIDSDRSCRILVLSKFCLNVEYVSLNRNWRNWITLGLMQPNDGFQEVEGGYTLEQFVFDVAASNRAKMLEDGYDSF